MKESIRELMRVTCCNCHKVHLVGKRGVRVENIEEDYQGRDLMTFTCPDCHHTVKGYPR